MSGLKHKNKMPATIMYAAEEREGKGSSKRRRPIIATLDAQVSKPSSCLFKSSFESNLRGGRRVLPCWKSPLGGTESWLFGDRTGQEEEMVVDDVLGSGSSVFAGNGFGKQGPSLHAHCEE